MSSHQQLKNIKIKEKKLTIFLGVLNGFENLSLILREAHRLKVFENRMLWGIF